MIVWDMPYPINYLNLMNSLKRAWKKDEYRKDGIYIHKVRRLPFFFPLINRVWFRRQLNKIARDFDLEVVISQSFFNETEPPKNLPLYFDLNDNYEAFAKIYGSFLYKLSYKLLRVRHTVESQLRRSEAVFAVSDLLVKYGKKFNEHVYKIPNGVDMPEIKSVNDNHLKYGKHSLVYVSTFGKWSRILDVIELIDKMQAKLPDICLVLVGEGTEFKAAQKLIDDKSLASHIKLLGPIYDRKKLFTIINNCKVCLNISEKNEFRDSASPIKIFEYSALGKTVVSTNLNEVMSLALPNVITYKADKESFQLEKAIVKAFKIQRDNSDVQKGIAANYSWDQLATQVIKIVS
jgi:glycosyltransferase involved in cell wall biosynthesis